MTAYPTQSYQDAYRKVTEYTDPYDLVVCSGGDGTIDEVVTGMMGREKKFRSATSPQELQMILPIV